MDGSRDARRACAAALLPAAAQNLFHIRRADRMGRLADAAKRRARHAYTTSRQKDSGDHQAFEPSRREGERWRAGTDSVLQRAGPRTRAKRVTIRRALHSARRRWRRSREKILRP